MKNISNHHLDLAINDRSSFLMTSIKVQYKDIIYKTVYINVLDHFKHVKPKTK